MNITLKNVKYFAGMSEETHCFTATVYVDNKKVFGVKNAGHGGDDEVYHVKGGVDNAFEKYREINEELGKEKCPAPYEDMDNCLDFVVGDLMNDWLRDGEIKKSLRKITYMKGAAMHEVKLSPTQENIERVKKQKWWEDTNVILNGMPIEEVRQYFS